MTYKLSAQSEKELNGVHDDLVSVVRRAAELTAQEFAVHDGIRTLAEQKQMVRSGASQTLDSRHLTGHAVDLVPVINGKLRWEWGPIYLIADAVKAAAKELQIPLRWGAHGTSILPSPMISRRISSRTTQQDGRGRENGFF